MTVRELIERLQAAPPDLIVYVWVDQELCEVTASTVVPVDESTTGMAHLELTAPW